MIFKIIFHIGGFPFHPGPLERSSTISLLVRIEHSLFSLEDLGRIMFSSVCSVGFVIVCAVFHLLRFPAISFPSRASFLLLLIFNPSPYLSLSLSLHPFLLSLSKILETLRIYSVPFYAFGFPCLRFRASP